MIINRIEAYLNPFIAESVELPDYDKYFNLCPKHIIIEKFNFHYRYFRNKRPKYLSEWIARDEYAKRMIRKHLTNVNHELDRSNK